VTPRLALRQRLGVGNQENPQGVTAVA